ncbi:hypothetical protein CAPTEDRAFT_161420 [Capitella teleta]|uniref:Cytochrome c oxidase subunit 4 n=1 Tax=Capitella teleta TaxID=283909 RepID=R7V7D4_CAPTE|nr:hypothetical protein CAPTEDRAFT_161420 [Capitella teleta]|eukprot:ELU14758.1 hypothetical protein CAPTEDRAFT_161420 [Capitella teleta]
MSMQIVRKLGRPAPQMLRLLSTSAARKEADTRSALVYPEEKNHFYPRIGDRKIVGYGRNGQADYEDVRDYPCPAVQFQEDKGAILALREKELGDWSALTLDEKKTLYRASFCSTYSEFTAKTGEWKSILAAVFTVGTLTALFTLFTHKYVYLPCRTSTEEWQADRIRMAIAERDGPVHGVSSYYDFEKKQWK